MTELQLQAIIAAASFVLGVLLQAFASSWAALDARMGCYRIERCEPLSSNKQVFVVQRFRPRWFLPSGWSQVGPAFSSVDDAMAWWKCLVKGNRIVIDAAEEEECLLAPIDKGPGD